MKKAIILLVLLFVVSCTVDQTAQPQDNEPPKTPGENAIDEPPTLEEIASPPDVRETPVDELIAPVESYEINLIVSMKDGKPTLVWTRYDKDFKGYKVVSSTTTANPEYPGDELIKTIGFVDETTFTDPSPDVGISYYRIAAINSVGQKTRSNVVKVELPNTKETPDQELNLVAEKTDSGVKLTWDKYEGRFLFYKVVWTNLHPNPKYPDDKTLATIAYANQTSYVAKMESGVNYYAITVVRPDKTRFTSNRVKVEV